MDSLFLKFGAEDEIRTRDVHLGKVTLYHWATPAYQLQNHYTWYAEKSQAPTG